MCFITNFNGTIGLNITIHTHTEINCLKLKSPNDIRKKSYSI